MCGAELVFGAELREAESWFGAQISGFGADWPTGCLYTFCFLRDETRFKTTTNGESKSF